MLGLALSARLDVWLLPAHTHAATRVGWVRHVVGGCRCTRAKGTDKQTDGQTDREQRTKQRASERCNAAPSLLLHTSPASVPGLMLVEIGHAALRCIVLFCAVLFAAVGAIAARVAEHTDRR